MINDTLGLDKRIEAQHIICRERWMMQWIEDEDKKRLEEFEDEEQEPYDNGDEDV